MYVYIPNLTILITLIIAIITIISIVIITMCSIFTIRAKDSRFWRLRSRRSETRFGQELLNGLKPRMAELLDLAGFRPQ